MQNIPDKLYFKIGEVSGIVGVDPHVLRYWESEFAQVRPLRAASKQRLYRRSDIESLVRIKDLLYDQGFTIAGAKQVLKEDKKAAPKVEEPKPDELLGKIKKELTEIHKILSN